LDYINFQYNIHRRSIVPTGLAYTIIGTMITQTSTFKNTQEQCCCLNLIDTYQTLNLSPKNHIYQQSW